MEALSPTMEEGQVVKWLKSEGDEVTNGELIAEIETDKATMELSARGDGVLRAIFVAEGATAPVGDVIAVIAGPEEDISEFGGGTAPSGEAPSGKAPGKPEAGEATDHPESPMETEASETDPTTDHPESPTETEASEAEPRAEAADAHAGDGPDVSGRIKASPLARRLAADSGLDLAAVSGSGPAGRIVKRDVEKALTEGVSRPPVGTAPSRPASAADYEDRPLSQMRKAIARRLTESIGPVPHFFLTVDVDMGRAMEARRAINAMLEPEGRKVSLNDVIVRATAATLRRHPACNAHWLGDSIRQFNRVHIGVAVAVEDGLITPVVRDADTKGVSEIGAEVQEMAGRARERKLKPEEYTGATFSISNLGMFGIHDFTAVINPPEAGILAIGGVEERPVVEDGAVVVRSRMRVTMSCDHRVIDGATGAAFLATLKKMLEEPAAILA